MARCFHIYDSGFQCVDEALESSEFCLDHQKVVPFERLEDSLWRKVVIRVAAILLLAALLIPFLYSLRNLYRGTPAQAQEVW